MRAVATFAALCGIAMSTPAASSSVAEALLDEGEIAASLARRPNAPAARRFWIALAEVLAAPEVEGATERLRATGVELDAPVEPQLAQMRDVFTTYYYTEIDPPLCRLGYLAPGSAEFQHALDSLRGRPVAARVREAAGMFSLEYAAADRDGRFFEQRWCLFDYPDEERLLFVFHAAPRTFPPACRQPTVSPEQRLAAAASFHRVALGPSPAEVARTRASEARRLLLTLAVVACGVALGASLMRRAPNWRVGES